MSYMRGSDSDSDSDSDCITDESVCLGELCGEGWVLVEPPLKQDDQHVVARYDSKPVKAGLLIDTVEDSRDVFHACYRTGCYDLDVRIHFDIGRGEIRVSRVSSYDSCEG